MLDKNGVEIKVGDSVRVPGCLEVKTVAAILKSVIVYDPPETWVEQLTPRHTPHTFAKPAASLGSLVEIVK